MHASGLRQNLYETGSDINSEGAALYPAPVNRAEEDHDVQGTHDLRCGGPQHNHVAEQ
jgi:hypothetical protein